MKNETKNKMRLVKIGCGRYTSLDEEVDVCKGISNELWETGEYTDEYGIHYFLIERALDFEDYKADVVAKVESCGVNIDKQSGDILNPGFWLTPDSRKKLTIFETDEDGKESVRSIGVSSVSYSYDDGCFIIDEYDDGVCAYTECIPWYVFINLWEEGFCKDNNTIFKICRNL